MTTPDPVRAYLAGLPQPTLPPGLWPRVQAARQRQHQRRRVARLSLAAAAALVLVAAPWLYLNLAPPAAAPSLANQAAVADTTPAEPNAAVVAQLRAVDRSLQEAYLAGASEKELQALWQARHQLAAGIDTAKAPDPIQI